MNFSRAFVVSASDRTNDDTSLNFRCHYSLHYFHQILYGSAWSIDIYYICRKTCQNVYTYIYKLSIGFISCKTTDVWHFRNNLPGNILDAWFASSTTGASDLSQAMLDPPCSERREKEMLKSIKRVVHRSSFEHLKSQRSWNRSFHVFLTISLLEELG